MYAIGASVSSLHRESTDSLIHKKMCIDVAVKAVGFRRP